MNLELGRPELGTPTERRQILCLSGGGYRGLYTSLVLEELERKARRPLADVFDVVAGTSIGGLIAAGLALGIGAGDIREAIETHGPRIFDPCIRWGRFRLPVRNPARALVRSRYPQGPLRNAIEVLLGKGADQPLSCITTPLIISAVDVRTATPQLLLSAGLAGKRASDLPLRDGLLGTSAAPTYFPPHRVQGRVLVDGGLIANAPDLVAVVEAVRNLACPLDEVRVLSVGTAGSPQRVPSAGRAPGIVVWLLRKRLVQLTLSVQEQLAVDQCGVLLRNRYLRLDYAPSPEEAAALRLDRASDACKATLQRGAKETIATFSGSNRTAIRRFLAHQARPRRGPIR